MNQIVLPSHASFSDYLDNFVEVITTFFSEVEKKGIDITQREFPPLGLKNIFPKICLSPAIPSQFGGRGGHAKEMLVVLEKASYESLPLSLAIGINFSLFLEPVAKYAKEAVKENIFTRFLNQKNTGGLMITEPNFGSDALNMQTSNEWNNGSYHIKGTKHWQGLTGMADYWLMTSRSKDAQGRLARDIDFFICDMHQPDQQILVEEYFHNIGLYPIPYGRNSIDIQVPEAYKLQPESTGLKLMLDLLHRSRFRFPGMGLGFIRRILDEAISHTQTRFVGGRPMIEMDQIQAQISKIQSAFTICSALIKRSAEFSQLDNNLSTHGMEANSIKAFVTDLMQESAQTLTQLYGANGYKMTSKGASGIVDSRPFQIFEGSNDMLYTQIAELSIKQMGMAKNMNLLTYLQTNPLTNKASNEFAEPLNFTIPADLPQRKLVDLGKIISRLITANHLLALANSGFRQDLVDSAIVQLQHEVTMLVSSYHFKIKESPVQHYQEASNWADYC